MKLDFVTKYENGKIVIDIPQDACVDEFVFNMIKNNNIPYILPMEQSNEGGVRSFIYRHPFKSSLAQRLASGMDANDLAYLLKRLCAICINMEAYMIDYGYMAWSPEFVFTDETTEDISFICLPLIRESGSRLEFADIVKLYISYVTPKEESSYNDYREVCEHIWRQSHLDAHGLMAFLHSISKRDEQEEENLTDKQGEAGKVHLGSVIGVISKLKGGLGEQRDSRTKKKKQKKSSAVEAGYNFAIPGRE